jgi:hypothetical protein
MLILDLDIRLWSFVTFMMLDSSFLIRIAFTFMNNTERGRNCLRYRVICRNQTSLEILLCFTGNLYCVVVLIGNDIWAAINLEGVH